MLPVGWGQHRPQEMAPAELQWNQSISDPLGKPCVQREVFTTLLCTIIKLENAHVLKILAGHVALVCNPSMGKWSERAGRLRSGLPRRLSGKLALDSRFRPACISSNRYWKQHSRGFLKYAKTLQEIVLKIHRAVRPCIYDAKLKHKTRNPDRKYSAEEGSKDREERARKEERGWEPAWKVSITDICHLRDSVWVIS